MLDFTKLKLEDVRGVGTIELDLEPGKQAYVFIGENGIGKTSLLEAIKSKLNITPHQEEMHVLIAAYNRGHFITRMGRDPSEKIRDHIHQWILTLSEAASPFKKNNQESQNKIVSLQQCLTLIDSRYSTKPLTIDENDEVFLEISGKETKLSDLSTGFAALVRIIQTILFHYPSDTLRETKGIVLIDEIESHLHLKWQAHIIPKLKELFPNTTFIIATHSPIVISQLEEGEAYKLARDDDGVIRSKKIENPRNNAMIDLLNDAFDIDMNEIAINRQTSKQQKTAKQELLTRLQQRKVAQ